MFGNDPEPMGALAPWSVLEIETDPRQLPFCPVCSQLDAAYDRIHPEEVPQ